MTKKRLEAVEDQPAETETELVLVEAMVPMWADNGVVPVGTRYHLPVEAAQYLAGLGFVAMATENEEAD